MPRPASKTHVLRTTRLLLGLSQVALAKKVGLSPDTIKRIENISLPMSEEVASRICAFTGVDEDQLLQNRNPSEPINIWREPFTKAWFKEVYTAEASQDSITFWLRYLDFNIRRLVDTGASENPKAVYSLITALFSAVGKVAADYKLRPKAPLSEFIEENWKDPIFRDQLVDAPSPWAKPEPKEYPIPGFWIRRVERMAPSPFSSPRPSPSRQRSQKAKSAKKPKRRPL